MAGRRSGASEEKEGERGLIHAQNGVLLSHHVLGGELRRAEVHVTQRAMVGPALPPSGALREHLALEGLYGVQSARPSPSAAPPFPASQILELRFLYEPFPRLYSLARTRAAA